jgi:predicted nucleic acid-binding protein
LVIYLDSAAVIKLVRIEAESAALVAWLNEHSSLPLVASTLTEMEVPRAVRRSQPGVLGSVAAVLARLYRSRSTRQYGRSQLPTRTPC